MCGSLSLAMVSLQLQSMMERTCAMWTLNLIDVAFPLELQKNVLGFDQNEHTCQKDFIVGMSIVKWCL
jgi:hypothetical protein